jgi:NAD(P)-dependent dehydrogenase (short-subunit alcohol dehydrogenase family)
MALAAGGWARRPSLVCQMPRRVAAAYLRLSGGRARPASRLPAGKKPNRPSQATRLDRAIRAEPPEAIEQIVSSVPMGRAGEPGEVAKAALFLASDDSSFITGIELFVGGGRAQI